MQVRTLLGAKGLDFTSACLQSLVSQSKTPIELVIHEDGSLNERHRDLLRARISPGLRFIGREEANDLVEPAIRAYPALRTFRATDVFAGKILDISIAESGPRVRYCDSDIFFFRPFEGLYGAAGPNQCMFMRDRFYAYAFSRNAQARHLFPLPRMLNAGLIDAPKDKIDLDCLEHLLASRLLAPGWTEQTMWAVLAKRMDAIWPEALTIPKRGDPLGHEVAWHLTSKVRGFWAMDNLMACAKALADSPTAQIEMRTFETMPYWRYVLHHMQHAVEWRRDIIRGALKDRLAAARASSA